VDAGGSHSNAMMWEACVQHPVLFGRSTSQWPVAVPLLRAPRPQGPGSAVRIQRPQHVRRVAVGADHVGHVPHRRVQHGDPRDDGDGACRVCSAHVAAPWEPSHSRPMPAGASVLGPVRARQPACAPHAVAVHRAGQLDDVRLRRAGAVLAAASDVHAVQPGPGHVLRRRGQWSTCGQYGVG